MKPFDLEKALAGEPVVTRDGKEANSFHLFDVTEYPLYAVVDGNVLRFTTDGRFLYTTDSVNDIFMAPKKRAVWVGIYPNGKTTSSWYDTEDECENHMWTYGTAYPIEIEE